MILLETMLRKLTDVFKKKKDSNIGKLLSIVAEQFEFINQTLDRMELWRDIDHAEGKHLDRIGEEIVGEFRGGSTDQEYRQNIKTKIVANFLSRGDIETINKLLQIYLGEHLLSVQNGWSLQGTPFDGEPAMLFVTIKGNGNPYGIPFDKLSQVVTGGVGTQWQYLLETPLELKSEYSRVMYPFEYYTGHLITGSEVISNDAVEFSPSLLNAFQDYSRHLNEYFVCGEFVIGSNEAMDYQTNFDVYQVASTNLKDYLVTGTFSVESGVNI